MKGLKYIVLAANIVIFALLSLALPICFEENDDAIMAMIANGGYSGTPDGHLVFINVLYGTVLAALYSLTKAVEWYTLSFAVLHILSMSVLVYFVLTIPNRAKWERIIWLLVLYTLWARILAALQFTTTAGLTCLAGCVLLLRKSNKARWTGIFFVLVASLIRITAAGLVGVLMAPIIVYTYRLDWRRYIPLTVMLMLVVGCRMTHNYIYQSDPAWNYYNTYNNLRGQLTDNPNAYTLSPSDMPEGVDWTDYQLLLRFIPDPEKMDLTTIQRLIAVVKQVSLKNRMQNIHHLDRYAVELAILFALLVLMILTTGNKTKYGFLILYTLFIFALMVYVSMDGFLKNRVFLCMLLAILMTDFMLLPDTTGQKRSWGIAFAIVALCGWLGYQTNCDQIRKRHRRHIWEDMQRPLLAKMPSDAIVVTIGTGLCMDAVNPWHVWPYSFTKYTLGWLTWCPLNEPVGHSYRVFLQDNVYLFTNHDFDNEGTSLQLVREQLEKHYDAPTEIECVHKNDHYLIVQLKKLK
ncbi:MAG: hypothetical protein IKM83_03535 [Paludibacteraceae bacterium]|nr:hypothetical protein [Paludibacteraceae bacterium]